MRKFIFLQFATLSLSFVSNSATVITDTSIIIHKMDGLADEWPADKFSADHETGIQYAIDNDARNLYVSMKVSGQLEQSKIMQMGMRLFIDLKGKRKQNLGIEFPIKKDNMGSDFEGLQIMLRLNPKMRLFGFAEGESPEQDIETNGGVISTAIAFNWDSTDAMNIEYLIPLQMLEQETLSLDHKLVSIGWKINGEEALVVTGPSSSTASTTIGGVPNNGAGRPSRMPGTNKPASNSDMEKMMKEQMIWTKYIFTFNQ